MNEMGSEMSSTHVSGKQCMKVDDECRRILSNRAAAIQQTNATKYKLVQLTSQKLEVKALDSGEKREPKGK